MTALVVAALSAREVGRRRVALALMVTLPLWFYLLRRSAEGQSVRMLALGMAWAVSALTLFVVNAARGVDPRLRLTGASTLAVIGGRLLALTAGGIALAAAYWALVVADQRPERPWAAALMMALTAVVAAPLGSLIAALLPRELEGALALLSICAVQMLADPPTLVAHLMPFWSLRELGTYVIDGADAGYLWRALLHAALTWLICAGGTYALFAWRLRLPRYPEP
ncbi:hypothetical protein [Paractinoplanes globisporus]|uniref:ABC transporter permease n=1 Tax=Paractinoplanes globisporus TaxID=113565 RepID=A0ABW6WJY7_9ACTN|nr:hypothetical protein [Actinoplanes globisporus]